MLRFRVLGSVDLRTSEGVAVASVLSQPKRVALLTYLVLAAPGGFHRRDTLVGLFWPESDATRARNSLNQAVHFLRRSLGESVIVSRGDELGVEPGRIWCDAQEFTALLDSGRTEAAMELYAGELLPGLYVEDALGVERWLESQRERLRSLAVGAAGSLADAAENAGDAPQAVRWVRRAVELEPGNEAAVRRLIVLLERSGDRAGALAAFEVLQQRLQDDFDASPSAETLALVETLRSPGPPPAPLRVPTAAPAASEPEAPPGSNADPWPQPAEALEEEPGRSASPATQPRAPGVRRRFRWWIPATLVVGLAVLWLVGRGILDRGDAAVPRTVLLADFQSAPGDSVLARIVTEALRIDLTQSRALRVVEPRFVREALRRMQQPGIKVLDPATAREVAMREGLDALVIGEVSRVGGGYLIAARLFAPGSDHALFAVREAAVEPAELISSIGAVSGKLRREFGESLRSVRASPPLERVTTPSLDALRSYSLALRAIDVEGDYARGIALLQQAVATDTAFAMAYRKLGVALLNTGAPRSRVLDAYERAYRHRDRLTERERFLVVAAYHGTSREEAIVAYRALLDLYPNDKNALNNLGYLYSEAGDPARSAEYYRRAVQVDSTFAVALSNLVEAEFDRGNLAGARQALAALTRRSSGNPRAVEQALYLAAATGDYARARSLADSLRAREGPDPFWRAASSRHLAHLAAVHGQLSAAEHQMGEAMRLALESGEVANYLAGTITLGLLDVYARRDTMRARQRMASALAAHPLKSLSPEDRPLVELAWFYAHVAEPERARAMVGEVRAASDPRRRSEIGRRVRAIEAATLLAARQGARAVSAIRSLEPTSCAICTLPALGKAHEMANQPDSAIAVYQRYLNTPEFNRLDQDAIWRPFVLQRLVELHGRNRRSAAARAHAGALLRLWRTADIDLRSRLRTACRYTEASEAFAAAVCRHRLPSTPD
jgi:DNA-binding SARP family transcriptional activator